MVVHADGEFDSNARVIWGTRCMGYYVIEHFPTSTPEFPASRREDCRSGEIVGPKSSLNFNVQQGTTSHTMHVLAFGEQRGRWPNQPSQFCMVIPRTPSPISSPDYSSIRRRKGTHFTRTGTHGVVTDKGKNHLSFWALRLALLFPIPCLYPSYSIITIANVVNLTR